MTDNRVLSAGAATREAQAARTIELIGDGSSITADDLAGFGVSERTHLHSVNPEKYRELTAEVDRRVSLANLRRQNGGR